MDLTVQSPLRYPLRHSVKKEYPHSIKTFANNSLNEIRKRNRLVKPQNNIVVQNAKSGSNHHISHRNKTLILCDA